jgi:hypothetical protein
MPLFFTAVLDAEFFEAYGIHEIYKRHWFFDKLLSIVKDKLLLAQILLAHFLKSNEVLFEL